MRIVGAKVIVTQKDIDTAKQLRWSTSNCPIGLALQRRFKTSDAKAGQDGATINGVEYSFEEVSKTRPFVINFDFHQGDDIEPFSFHMGGRTSR